MNTREAKPHISVVVVTWNSQADIGDCLASLENQDYPNYNILVVDNASTDQTVEIVERDFPQIELVKSKRNLFFTGGHNLGIRSAIDRYLSPFVAIINPDTVVETNWLTAQMQTMNRDKRVGMVGPKIVFWGNENEGLINSAGLVYDGFMQAYDRGYEERDDGQYDLIEEVPGLSGCSILFRSSMLGDVGLFWEVLKMYLEDLELSIRAQKKGWKIMYTPHTTVRHKHMQSTKQSKVISHQQMLRRNWLLIALRHYPLKSKLAMVRHYFQRR